MSGLLYKCQKTGRKPGKGARGEGPLETGDSK